ncbi:MAG: hypothetical protein JWO31_1785 [Phycisphaerales bacterium]|nr:hypothetical protein [Phycisphaerales bacterium]
MLVFALPSAVLLLCLVLVAVAYRGRPVDNHPLCRRCGFDLTGKPVDSFVCSECGADLNAPRAVRIGHRQPRRRLLAAAAAVGLLAAGWVGIAGYGRASKVDWNRHAPAWWLVREAKGKDAATRDLALVELAQRISVNALSRPRVDELAELGLLHQTDRSATWVPGWGDIVEAARAAGTLSDDGWKQYRLRAGNVTLEVRPVVRRGDPVPFWIHNGPTRLAAKQFYRTTEYGRTPDPSYSKPGDGLAIDGKPVPEYRNAGSDSGILAAQYGGGASGSNITLPDRVLRELGDGPHEMVLTIRSTVTDGPPAGNAADDPTAASEVIELRATFTLGPADRPTVTLNPDPTLRPAVERALTVTQADWNTASGRPSGYLNVSVQCSGTPIGLAYSAAARPAGGPSGGPSWSLGTLNFSPSTPGVSSSSGYGLGASGRELAGFDADRIDVVLTPSLPAAVRTTNLTQIWDGEVIIRNVPVKRRGPAAVGKPALSGSGSASRPASRPATVPTPAAGEGVP